MLFTLDPRIRQVHDAGRQPMRGARLTDLLGEGLDRELLGELVEDPVLACGRRVLEREPDAGDRVADVEKAARLPALAVYRQRQAKRRLNAEAIQHGPPDRVEVEARGEPGMRRHFVRPAAVDDALVQVGRAQAPDPAGELDVVAVMEL